MITSDVSLSKTEAYQNMTMEKKQILGKAIGRLVSGVYVLTLENKGKRDGLLVSWVSQCAFSPPMLSVAIAKDRPILQFLNEGQSFSVNILSNQSHEIFKNFARPYEANQDRFAGCALKNNHLGAPVFTEAIAYLDCYVRFRVESGDHLLIIGEIIDGTVQNNAEPMIHLRKNGFQY